MENPKTTVFPVGYHKFHKKQVFNFQLNRWHSIGFARFEDMKAVGQKIKTFTDWKVEMIKLAEKAIAEKRFLNAAIYYRSAEFYIIKANLEKEDLYKKFTDLFYQHINDGNMERFKVPYNESFLPVIKIPAAKNKKGVIVMHGGFDSFIEEWYFMIKYLSDFGYEIIAFEGPGQGAALKTYGIPLDIEWEEPTKAVLDFFNLNDVTLWGLSMGGWYARSVTDIVFTKESHAHNHCQIGNIKLTLDTMVNWIEEKS